MKFRQRVAAVALSTAVLTGLGVTEAAAGPPPHSWSKNWEGPFKTRGDCWARGSWIVGAPPRLSPGIPGIDKFKCVKRRDSGHIMMDVRWYGRYAL